MLSVLLLGLSGQFSGPGTAVTPRRARACEEIFLDLKHTNDKLVLSQGGYICEDMKASFDPFVMQIQNEELVYQGAVVGKITDTTLDITFDDTDEGYTYELHLLRTENKMQYEERWLVEGQKALVVQGNLTTLHD